MRIFGSDRIAVDHAETVTAAASVWFLSGFGWKLLCMVHSLKAPTNFWFWKEPKERYRCRCKARFAPPSAILLHAACLGRGISMHPTYMVDDDLRDNRLAFVLPDYTAPGLSMYAVFPSRKNMPVRVRTFLDFMKDGFAHDRWTTA